MCFSLLDWGQQNWAKQLWSLASFDIRKVLLF